MEKKYISVTRGRAPLPRSKRLRQEGVGGGRTGSSIVTVGGSNTEAGTGHTHSNLNDLDKISTDNGYIMLQQASEDQPNTIDKVKAGWADNTEHANNADEALHAQNAEEAKHATKATDAEKWAGHNWDEWLDQPVRSFDSVRFGCVNSNDLQSVREFVDGLLGSGYRMWMDDNGLAHLTVDKLTVRQTMTVLELLVEKVRSIGGALVVSAANGKVASVEESGDQYKIAFEQDNTFVKGDLIRCSTWSGTDLKSYWAEVIEADSEGVTVAKASMAGVMPAAGDECVLMGNTTNANRQNLIMISATEDGQPRIDVMNGVHTTSLDGCLRVRLGNLDGIRDEWFDKDHQPHGDGIYADNAYLKGTFLLETGEDVKTKFEVTEGKIESVADGLRQDFAGEKSYLSNAAFASGMDMWQTENEAVFYVGGTRWIWANDNMLSKQGASAKVVTDQGRKVVRIRNRWIGQKNSQLLSKPEMTELANGKKEAVPMFLSFFYRCAKAGKLTVGFESVDKTGFTEFDSLHIEEDIAETTGYEQWTGNGMWNGTGDFRLSFTGEIYLYMLILTTDRVNALSYRYRTLFEQTENLVRICAAVYDKDAQALQETGLFIRPEGAGILTQDAEGNVAFIGTSVDEVDAEGHHHSRIKLGAENIQLEGVVTANENFRIREDGSVEAKNGRFSGRIEAQSGTFDGYVRTTLVNIPDADGAKYLAGGVMTLKVGSHVNLRSDNAAYRQVKLPNDASYIGARVLIVSTNFSPYDINTIDNGVGVYCEQGDIYNYPTVSQSTSLTGQTVTRETTTNVHGIYLIGGQIELLGVQPIRNGEQCSWMLLNHHAAGMQPVKAFSVEP